MYAVGRLGNYITRGVYTVSGPFHPFGGAVDIIVVEQPDGSFKSSPWYVRFGKFQGVLKAKEKVVNISVNGIDANFHMYLDQRGEAYFLREVEGEEGESVSSSSGDESNEQSQKSRRPMKSKSCYFDGFNLNLDDQIDASDGKIVARTNSQKSRIFGLAFGRRSMKQDSYPDGDDVNSAGIVRIGSLERAEIAANLLDVKWSTNLATSKPRKDNASWFSASNTSDRKVDKHRLTSDRQTQLDSSMPEASETSLEHCMLAEKTGSCDVEMGKSSQSAFENQEFSIQEASVEMSTLGTIEQIIETYVIDDSAMEEISEISKGVDEPSIRKPDHDNAEGVISEVSCSESQTVDVSEAFPGSKFDEEQVSNESNIASPGVSVSEEETGSNRTQSFIYCEKSENLVVGSDGSKEESEETLYLTSGGPGEVHFCAKTLHLTTELLSEDAVIQQAEEIELETVHIESCDDSPQQTSRSPPSIHRQDEVNLQVPLIVSESYTQKISKDPILGFVEIESESISSISEFSNLVRPSENEIIRRERIKKFKFQPSLESVGDLEQLNGDYDLTKAVSAPVSESSEEEQFLFSDFNNFKHKETQIVSNFPAGVDKEDRPSYSPEGTHKINEPLNTNEKSYSSHDSFFQKNQLSDTDNSVDNSKLASNPISIPKFHTTAGAEVGRLAESLPNIWTCAEDWGTENCHCPLSHSLDSHFKSVEWKSPIKEESCCIYSDRDKDTQLSPEHSNKEDFHFSENIKSGVANPAIEISLCRHLLYEGMGAEAASQAFDSEKLDIDKLTSLGPAIVKNDRLIVRIGGCYFPWDAAAPIVLGMAAFGSDIIFEPKGMILVDRVEKSLVGDSSKAIVTTGGSWRLWPFTFSKSRSSRTMQSTPTDTGSSDVENVSESNNIMNNDKNVVKTMVLKKKVRAKTPTSEELASLNLKEGSNVVTFTFSTAMLGRQKVDARIYLWKWNTRIVISDVDGTITKSDVLGQFMPLVGVDWSQTGVAHLFSAIKENGYQLLFLSARAISQAYHTRQFLVNLKQDGKALPDGPVVISPDGLFPSLFREVIRRAPHEFKIACLENIKALFPPDCNPFYAGFGNRDTDEFSYLKVGIPMGKIFIINPKGEVAVNRRVDTKSYTSLHALVHGMFPVMKSSEQEDFNSWNYWKLPPPDIDI